MAYTVADLLYEVTITDLLDFIGPCLGYDSPFNDNEKIEIMKALKNKGFGNIFRPLFT